MKPVFTQEPVLGIYGAWSSFASLQDIPASSEANRAVRTSVTVFGLALSLGASGALFSGVEAAESTRLAYLPSTSGSPGTLPSYGSDRPSGAAASYHTVVEGETIWDIAKQYGIDVEEIKIANAILDGHSIQAGQVLKVPVYATTSGAIAEQPSSRVSVEIAAAEPLLGSVESKPATANSDSVGAPLLTDEVETSTAEELPPLAAEGQLTAIEDVQIDPKRFMFEASLDSSSVDADVQPERLAALPSLSTSRPDEQLDEFDNEHLDEPQDSLIVEPTELPEPSSESDAFEAVITVESNSNQAIHRITAGETIWSIAYTHGIDPEELRAANQIVNPNVIFPGDTLLLPGVVLDEAEAGNLFSNESVDEPTNVSANVQDSLRDSSTNEPEPKTLAEEGIPVFDVDAAAAEPPAAEDISVVEVPTLEVDTLSFSETEMPLLAATPEMLQEESSTSIAVDFDPAAEAVTLESSSRVLGEGENVASETSAQGLVGGGRGVLSEIRQSGTSSEQFLAATASASPEREASLLDTDSTDALDEAEAVIESSQELLAAAPLGSEVYAPIVETPEGRVVSPEWPVLPDQENYLPDAPSRFEGYMWPAQGVLTSGYGWRWGRMHQGIDIAGPVGTPIFSAAPGTVIRSGWSSGGYGNIVDIRHPDGSLTRYAHNSRLLVEEGEEVRQGQQIAEMGNTGYSTGPHLHFEIHLPDQGAVNPSALLPSQ